MSDSQEAKRSAQERMLAQAIDPGPGGLWSLSDVQTRLNGGLELPIGARMPVATPLELLHAGISVGGAPGNEGMWAGDYLTSTGMSLEEFGRTYKSLPFDFHGDGTMSYNPSAVQNRFDYTPGSYSRNAMIGIGGVLALATAGLAAGAMGGTAGATAGGTTGATSGAIGGMEALVGGSAGEFSLAGAGGLNGASAGLGLKTAGIGLTPGLTAAGGGAAAMGVPAGIGLTLGGGAIADTATALAAMGGTTLDAIPANLVGPASGINGTNLATQAAKTVAEKTIGDRLVDAGGKVLTNLATGAITNAIAGDGKPTSNAGLTNAQQLLNGAAGKLPTEDEAAAQAHADVTQAFNTQRNAYRRQLMGYGLNPDSARYQSTMGRFQGAEAKTDALGQNLARRGVRSAALGEAATLANISAGLTNAQAVLDAQNFQRQQAVQAQVRQGLAPIVSAVAPTVSNTISNWFDMAKSGISNWSSGFDDTLVGA